jgi:hypothetical protein
MPSIVRNPSRALPRIKIPVSNYRKLVALGLSMVAGMTGNAYFATPLPTLTSVGTLIIDLQNKIAALGTKNNKGPATAVGNAKTSAQALAAALTELASYINNTATITAGNDGIQMRAIVASAGIAPRKLRAKIDTMGAVNGLHLVNTKKKPAALGYIAWKKPLGNFTGNKPTGYLIQQGGSPPLYLTTVTQTKYRLGFITSTPQLIIVTPISRRGVGLPTSIYLSRLT